MTERQTTMLRQLTEMFGNPSPAALQLPNVQYLRTLASRLKNERSVLGVGDAVWLEGFWFDMIGKQRPRISRRGKFDRVSTVSPGAR